MQDLIISSLNCTEKDGAVRSSATIDGDEVFFTTIGAPSHTGQAEPFIAIALLEAMVTGRAIRLVDCPPVSSRVLRALNELQAVLACWNSALQRVPVTCEESISRPLEPATGCFFSGGIDSMHTLLENVDEVSHLIVARGFDHDDSEDGWQRRVAKQAEFAEMVGKRLVQIDTNARVWMEGRKLTWRLGHGLYLSSIGSMMGFTKALIGSSHAYDELFPWVSHPLTDPLWSTETTEVVHYGSGLRRTDKTKILLENQLFADHLTVCWRSSSSNCGRCHKCVRTMMAIDLLGGTSAAFPQMDDNTPVNVLGEVDENLITMITDLAILARKKGRKRWERSLNRYRRLYYFKLALVALDDALFLGGLRAMKNRMRPPEWSQWRVHRRGGKPGG